MLVVENLDLYYGDAPALEGVSLEVPAGEIVAIVGANGAGKSSLIRTIAGIERARAGVAKAREIMDVFPPLTEGSLHLETPTTYLSLAEAELSRATEPDPALWEEAVDRADFAYFRLYSQWRLAEALLALGRTVEAEQQLRDAHTYACRIGADLVRRRLEALAGDAAFELDAESRIR